MPSLLSSLFGRKNKERSFSTDSSPASSSTALQSSAATDPLEPRAQQIGRELLQAARDNKGGLLSKKFWNDKLMDYAMKDPAFKVQLFRFVDAFPTLKTPEQVYDHLVDYMQQPGVKVPAMIATGMKAGGMLKGTFAKQMSGQITGMANGFIAGTDARDALPKLKKLWDRGLAFSVDLLGEACVSSKEADEYLQKYLDLVENLPEAVADWPTNERLEKDHLGSIPRTNVSIKISSLSALTDPIAFERVIEISMGRIVPILEAAKKRGVFINFDMESFATKDLTLELFKRCCEAVEFEGGIAMQAYLRSGDADAKMMIDWAKSTGRQVTVRLVKGAYWDYETIHAEEMGWPQPVWPTKPHTDACFERMARQFIESTPASKDEGGIKLACGSHNVRSIAVALAALEKRDLPKNAIELQMLYGMAGELKDAAEEFGLRVREYVPVGDMIPGMAYLVRRLLENTSNESWLKAGFLDNASPEQLLIDPRKQIENLKTARNVTTEIKYDTSNVNEATPGLPSTPKPDVSHDDNGVSRVVTELPHDATTVSRVTTEIEHVPSKLARDPMDEEHDHMLQAAAIKHKLSDAPDNVGDGLPFYTEPMRDFAFKSVRDEFARHMDQSVPGVANDGSIEMADIMVKQASEAFAAWRDRPVRERSEMLM